MRSSYKKLGEYIRPVDERNSDGSLGENNLYGISVTKDFIVTHANLVGVTFDSYKVVAPRQFAYIPDTSRRGDKIAISLNTTGEKIIVSSICTVFEIADEDQLLPEYLMLWFMRPEFDRYARFMSNGSAREVFDWDCMCGVELPVPTLSEQRKIVRDYQVVTDRIKLLRGIIEKTDTQMRIYAKEWTKTHAVEEGKLSEYCQMEYGFTETASTDEVGPKFLRITDITDSFIDWNKVPYCHVSEKDLAKYKLQQGDVVIARTGATSGAAKLIWKNTPEAVFASFLVRLIANNSKFQLFLALCVTGFDFYKYVQSNAEMAGSAQPQANPPLLGQYILSVPTENDLPEFNSVVCSYLNYIDQCASEISKLKSIQELLLAGITVDS